MDWNVGVMVDRCKVDTGQQRAVIVTAVAAVETRVLVRVTGTRTGNRCLSRGLLKSSQHQKLIPLTLTLLHNNNNLSLPTSQFPVLIWPIQ